MVKSGVLIWQIFQIIKLQITKDLDIYFVIIDHFSKFFWAIPLRKDQSQTIIQECPNILTTSKRSPVKLESDRGAEFYNSIFQNFLQSKNIQRYSRFTDESPSIAKRVFRFKRNLLKKPIFLKGNADWLTELPSIVKQKNNTIHKSIKMTPIQASKKSKRKEVYSNLKDNREVQKPKFYLGQFVQVILKKHSQKEIVQTIGISFKK